MTSDHPDIVQIDRRISATFAAAEATYRSEADTRADWLARYGELQAELARAKARNT
jgi:hypothetical protein